MKKFSLKKLPLITILVAVILAIGLILFVGKYSKKTALSQLSLWSKEITVESQNRDNDNDGLTNWQEDLYKTDPNNPDTDGDGYSDGEEINSGRNPLVKAPGDMVFLYPLPLGEKYNITQHIFQDNAVSLLNSYLLHKSEYLKDHPEITDPTQFLASVPQSIQRELINKAIYDNFSYIMGKSGEIFSQFPEIFNMTISDQEINILQDNSKEAIQIYLSKLSSFINSDDFFFQKNGFDALSEAIKTNDFSKLNEIIKLNDSKIDQMKEIPVPSSLKEMHKQALKTAILARNIFISIQDLENDPVKAFLFSQKIDEVFNNWLNLSKEISDLIKKYEE
jgi:hypothetical protein